MTNAPGSSGKPVVTGSGNTVHIVWYDLRDGPCTIYYKHSADGGITWGPDTKLSSDTANSLYPVGTYNFVVWMDDRDGNWEIYYKIYTGVPAVNLINPNQGTAGQTLDNVIITGANFTGATGVSFGGGITVNSYHVISDTQIQVSITITPGATPGARNVSVTTHAGTGTKTGAFTVGQQSIGTGAPAPRGSSGAGTAATTQAMSIANIQTQSASLSASAVAPGTPVTVTADIANKSTANGSKKVTLYVNGEVDSTQGVTVNSGSSSQLTFNISRSEPGSYKVYVDGAPAGSFKVEAVTANDTILIVSVTMLAIAFILGMVMLRRRQQGIQH